MPMIDLRCDGVRKNGPKRGLSCAYLLFRYSPAVSGPVETKCPRCNQIRLWNFSGLLVGGTS